MSTSGRLLLLFFLACAFWGTPACFAGQDAHGHVAAEPSFGMRPGFAPPPLHRELSEPASEAFPSDSFGRASAKGHGAEPPIHGAALARSRTAPALPSDILLLIQRQNE